MYGVLTAFAAHLLCTAHKEQFGSQQTRHCSGDPYRATIDLLHYDILCDPICTGDLQVHIELLAPVAGVPWTRFYVGNTLKN